MDVRNADQGRTDNGHQAGSEHPERQCSPQRAAARRDRDRLLAAVPEEVAGSIDPNSTADSFEARRIAPTPVERGTFSRIDGRRDDAA
jgi:hypothetical protein